VTDRGRTEHFITLQFDNMPSIHDFRDQLFVLFFHEDATQDELLEHLHKVGVHIVLSTLKEYLRMWHWRRVPDALIDRQTITKIGVLCLTTTWNDTEIAAIVANERGIFITPRQVKRLRLKRGWRRRNRQVSDQAIAFDLTAEEVKAVLADGVGRQWGREWVLAHLRAEYGAHRRQWHVQSILRQLDPQGTTARTPGMRPKRRHEYIVAGPNHVWCMDGHDKLRNYGIEIYAAIDAFSRKIMWFYVGLSNKTQVSVIRQYLIAVRAGGICPCFVRTDKGVETPMMADAQLSFFVANALEADPPWEQQELAEISLRDCYLYGTSTANTRIEKLWDNVIEGQTLSWMEYFHWLVGEGFYRSDRLSDQAVFLFVFIPILRYEIEAWVNAHNEHHIRLQTERIHHISGKPNDLYELRGEQPHGFSPNAVLLDQMEALVCDYGRSI